MQTSWMNARSSLGLSHDRFVGPFGERGLLNEIASALPLFVMPSMKRFVLTPLIAFLASFSLAEEYHGIEFPAGAISFADTVISYQPDFAQGAVPSHGDFFDPQKSLSIPDYPIGKDMQPGSVSLGSGGRVTLKFVDNVLTGSGSEEPDLHIFEVGTDVEDTFVEISREGREWHPVGKVTGSISSIDIDAFGFSKEDHFRFVRLTDDANEGRVSGETVGADIDAVGAISTIAKTDRSSWWILILVVLLILVSLAVFCSKNRRLRVCLSFASSAMVLAVTLICLWWFGFYLSWAWTVCLLVLSLSVILCSFWLNATVRRHSLPKWMSICAFVSILIGCLIIVLLFIGGLL